MRCFAIAEAAADQGLVCRFAMRTCPDELRDRLNRAGFAIADLPDANELDAFLALIDQTSPHAVVIDGYQFNDQYRSAVHAASHAVLTMDDLVASQALHADLLVNANPAANPVDYAGRADQTRLLLGLEFAPLRKEFSEAARPSSPALADRDRLLVTFGGSDPLGLSAPIVDGLLAAGVKLDLVLGREHPDHDALAALAAGDVLLNLHVDSRDMAALMASAGLAISAAGSTVLELAAMGMPAILAVTAKNQAPVLKAHKALAWCDGLDARDTGSEAPARIADMAIELWRDLPRRQKMAEKAHTLVDGKGAERIVAALLEFTGPAR
jgi:UDP-2,4-diacetamido-2,4,6-trideoxy-beta-L-altropyranose hydrolase